MPPHLTATTTRSRWCARPTSSTIAGMVVDYYDLDPVKHFIDATIDHRHLNDVLPGEPTAERLAWWLFESCKGHLAAEVAGRARRRPGQRDPEDVGRVPADR